MLTVSQQVEAFLKANDADEKGLEGDAKKQANGERSGLLMAIIDSSLFCRTIDCGASKIGLRSLRRRCSCCTIGTSFFRFGFIGTLTAFVVTSNGEFA